MIDEDSIGFIGGGNIAMAMISGLLDEGLDPGRIRVADPMAQQRARFTPLGVQVSADNIATATGAGIVVLSVKPDVITAVTSEIAGCLPADSVVVSVAAGITLSSLQASLGNRQAIIRCMPNTPALIRCGATGVIANHHVNEKQHRAASDLLGCIGIVEWVEDEAQIDAVTAISGSGPAYFFLIMEIMEETARDMGLPVEVARRLIAQTLAGAAGMVQKTDEAPADLRRRVTSPGGTTAAAIRVFGEQGLSEVIRRGLVAARDRSIELANQ